MSQVYSNPAREHDPNSLPDVEVFYAEAGEWLVEDDEDPNEAGWYWQPCFPGCLPDGEPRGPYETEKEAIEAAQDPNDDHIF